MMVLTKCELEIMDILWESEKPLSFQVVVNLERIHSSEHWSPTLLAPRTGFMKNSFSMAGGGGWGVGGMV